MQATDVREYLRELDDGWVDFDETVDTFKAGDAEAEVEGIAVAWMSTPAAMKRADDLGCSLFITHEPTFYNHHDRRDPDLPPKATDQVRAKIELVEALGLTVLRCHDLWDKYPGEGVPSSWGQQLLPGADEVDGEGYFRVFDRGVTSLAREVASSFVERTDQSAVQFFGPMDAPVRRVCVGTGAATPFKRMWQDYDADLYVCSDDGFTYWQDGALAREAEVPVVVANHATSEEASMASLAAHLDGTFDVPVHHVEQGCQYTLVGSPENEDGKRR